MLLTIHLYDKDKVKEQDYSVFTLNYVLQERFLSDIFSTHWLELNAFDYLCYDQICYDYQYCKLFLEHSLVYSGSTLDVNELQSKIKHLTRQDSKLI